MMSMPSSLADAGGLAGDYTVAEEREALAILSRLYGHTGTLARFSTEKDDTFRVTTPEGERFILKIANPNETEDELDFLNSLMAHASLADPGLRLPQVLPSMTGGFLPRINDAVGQDRFVRLMTYLDGKPLDSTTSTAGGRTKIGVVLARLRLATAGFQHPAENRVLAWDVQHLASLEGLLAYVQDSQQRTSLSKGLERFLAIEPRLKACRRQVLHNDFSRSNIVVDHEDPAFITGIIDFGDSVKTAIAIDVATALLNQLPRQPRDDLFADGRDVLTGYLQVTELTEEELRLIPHLVMARVVARALLTLWRATLFPRNQTYILRNTEQGWHQLDWFLSRSIDQVSDELNAFL